MSDWQIASDTLRISAQLVEGVQSGLAQRGFTDIRPVHGFAFAALSTGDLNTGGLAGALGVTKQAAAQLVEYLVERGYLTRQPDPTDGRAQLLVLTARGHACTRAAEAAAADVIAAWRAKVSPTAFAGFSRTIAGVAEPGRLRPGW